MVTIITELSKYAMILSLAIYTVLGFRLVRRDEAGKKAALWQQNVLMFGMQFLGNLTLYLSTENEKILLFYSAGSIYSVPCFTESHLSECRSAAESQYAAALKCGASYACKTIL